MRADCSSKVMVRSRAADLGNSLSKMRMSTGLFVLSEIRPLLQTRTLEQDNLFSGHTSEFRLLDRGM